MDLSFGLIAKTKYKKSNALFVCDLHIKNLFTKSKCLLPISVNISFTLGIFPFSFMTDELPVNPGLS